MYQFSIQKTTFAILTSLFAVAAFSVEAAHAPKDEIYEWIDSCPYIGLVSNSITYGPITLKDFNLAEIGKVIIAEPNEEINGTVKYRVDSNKMDSLKFHHIILGIKGETDSQSCLTHLTGLWDIKGKASFTLFAPAEKGIYEILFDYQTAITCGNAIEKWNAEPPSSSAVVGFIIVK